MIKKERDELIRSLMEEEKELVMSEGVFVQRWLPVFHGTYKDSRDKSNIGLWVKEVCKSNPKRTVSIKNNAGETLYVIPSILRGVITAKEKNDQFTLGTLIQAARMQQHPVLSRKIMSNLGNRVKVEDYDANADLQFWNALFTRYGFPTIGPNKSETKEDEPTEVIEKNSTDGLDAEIIDDDNWDVI